MNFSATSQTYCLKENNIFISSFPGKIVFGLTSQIGYEKLKHFEFQYYHILNFFLAVVKIVQFFATAEEEKGLILDLKDKIYFWSGKSVIEDGKPIKIVKFGIECKGNISFEIVFNTSGFNNFIHVFTQLIFPCLCLKSLERQLFESAANKSITYIVNLKNLTICESFLKSFENEQRIEIDDLTKRNLIDVLIYYKEIILLYKKLKSLYNSTESEEGSRLESILNS
jgi:hypothetical protein